MVASRVEDTLSPWDDPDELSLFAEAAQTCKHVYTMREREGGREGGKEEGEKEGEREGGREGGYYRLWNVDMKTQCMLVTCNTLQLHTLTKKHVNTIILGY